MLKKYRSLIILLTVLFIAGGCGAGTPRTLGSDIQIPENGLIASETLKEIKEKNLVTVFKGNSNGYSYEWTIFGNELDITDEINLSADIFIDKKFQTEIVLHGDSSPFHSVISVHTGSDLRGIHFDAYESENGKQIKTGTVTVTGEENSILNFSPGKLSGKYILRPESETAGTDTAVSKTSAEKIKNTSKKETVSTHSETVCVSSVSADVSNSEKIFSEDINTEKPQTSSAESDIAYQNTETAAEEKNDSELRCTVLVECTTVFSNLSKLEPGIIDTIPQNGIIIDHTETTFSEGESVFDVIKRLCTENKIHFEFEHVPLYNSSYITAFNNLYEFDCGSLSGWLYSVNGWFPNYGSSCYELKNNDVIEWRYSCDLGKDVNGGQTVNQYQ